MVTSLLGCISTCYYLWYSSDIIYVVLQLKQEVFLHLFDAYWSKNDKVILVRFHDKV